MNYPKGRGQGLREGGAADPSDVRNSTPYDCTGIHFLHASRKSRARGDELPSSQLWVAARYVKGYGCVLRKSWMAKKKS